MSVMSEDPEARQKYLSQAKKLKVEVLKRFYDASPGVYRPNEDLPSDGICQDNKAHAVTMGLLPSHANDLEHLIDPQSQLPRAFWGLAHWSVADIVSPYATGFAVEALSSRHQGLEARRLIERVWGPMADTSNPNYSGGHWEAMKTDGTSHGHDTSLMHGWSTWPVSLLPRYLAGLQPTKPGWTSFRIAPVFAGLERISCTLATVAGSIGVEIKIDEAEGHGTLKVMAPFGVHAQLQPPKEWVIQGPESIMGTGAWQNVLLFKPSVASGAQEYPDAMLQATPICAGGR